MYRARSAIVNAHRPCSTPTSALHIAAGVPAAQTSGPTSFLQEPPPPPFTQLSHFSHFPKMCSAVLITWILLGMSRHVSVLEFQSVPFSTKLIANF